MPTCQELDDLIADLADQISDKETLIVGSTAACLSYDVYMGNKPTPPLTLASVNTRIGELQMLMVWSPTVLHPGILNSIASYTAIKQMMEENVALELQRQQAIQTKMMMNCP